MKITDYRRSTIGRILGTVTSIGGMSPDLDIAAQSGWVPVATSSNTYEWRDAISFGSNTNDVSSVGTMGSSPSNTRADHVHRGVHAITAAGSNALYGDVNLVAGTGMGITVAGQNVRFDSSGAVAAGTYFLASDGGQGVRALLGAVGTTETIDLGNGLYQRLTLNANCTVSFTGWTSGTYCEVSLRLTEDATGGWTPTFSGVTWVGGTTPTHTTTAGTSTEYAFWSDDGGATIVGGQLGAGGSASPLTTKGDLWGYSTVDARVSGGNDDQILAARSTEMTGLRWIDDERHAHAVGEIQAADGSSSTYYLADYPDDDTVAAYVSGVRTDVTQVLDAVTFSGVPPVGATLRFDYIVETL